ncbi:MAG TPA: hypothetical protein VNS58_25510 [Puia sp.]|nr:hypothetical protein [Puia sp.]
MSKTILITGTSSGFGKLMALDLAKKGHRVNAAIEATTIEQMKYIFEVNLWGTVRNILAVLPSMRRIDLA